VKYFKLVIESLTFAFKAVIINRLRTFLSLLGITIGIFAIISVFTVIDSLENNIRESLAGAGENVTYVQKWPWAPEEGEEFEWWQYWNRPVPKISEYKALKDRSNFAEVISFFAFSSKRVEFENNNIDRVNIWGASEEFADLREFELTQGRFLTSFEFNSGKNLAVIGHTIADKLFESGNPLGKQIEVGGMKVLVIGVFAKEGNSILGGGSMDEIIFFPVHYLARMVDIKRDNANPMIWVKAKPNISNDEMKNEIRSILRSERRLKPRARFFYRYILHTGGRFWYCKYHVCIRQGTNQPDWDSKGSRSKKIFYPVSVPV